MKTEPINPSPDAGETPESQRSSAPTGSGLNWVHRHQGGTFITNFQEEDWSTYETAIEASGFKYLRLDRRGCPPGHWLCSLHNVGRSSDLSDFWRVWEAVSKRLGQNAKSEGSPPSRLENKQERNGDSLH